MVCLNKNATLVFDWFFSISRVNKHLVCASNYYFSRNKRNEHKLFLCSLYDIFSFILCWIFLHKKINKTRGNWLETEIWIPELCRYLSKINLFVNYVPIPRYNFHDFIFCFKLTDGYL